MTPADAIVYTEAVLNLYLELPDTPVQVSSNDRFLAHQLHNSSVPLDIVEAALLLGSLRRLIRPDNRPPLSPIRSLAYFQPVIVELQQAPLPAGYLDYLRRKLRAVRQVRSNDVQKNTFSRDR